jgi:pyrimidine-nucleoside phosphorylase
MLKISGVVDEIKEGRERLERILVNGDALEKFREMVSAQGGDAGVVDNFNLLPDSREKLKVKAKTGGYVTRILAEEVGLSAMMLGAGRETKEDKIDLGVGVTLTKKLGDKVEKGETLAILHVNDDKNLTIAKDKLINAYNISKEKAEEKPLIYEIVKK